MRIGWRVRRLTLDTPLRISRGVMADREAVEVYVEHDGERGWGELVTSGFQQLDVTRAERALHEIAIGVERLPDPESLLEAITGLTAELVRPVPGVVAAVDAAAYDLVGRRAGVPMHVLTGQPGWRPVPTARTIGLDAPEAMASTASALVGKGFEVLKLKLGGSDGIAADLARVAAVRAGCPDTTLLVDPNGGWTPARTPAALEALAGLGVAAAEQPVPSGDVEGLCRIAERSPVPVIADEDAVTADDVRRVAGRVAGINVKLAKCGGPTRARGLIADAVAGGSEVMLGCLTASTLGLAPAVHLTGSARWVDLDGHLLLAHDPWTGIDGDDGTLRLSGAPGLGVREVAA